MLISKDPNDYTPEQRNDPWVREMLEELHREPLERTRELQREASMLGTVTDTYQVGNKQLVRKVYEIPDLPFETSSCMELRDLFDPNSVNRALYHAAYFNEIYCKLVLDVIDPGLCASIHDDRAAWVNHQGDAGNRVAMLSMQAHAGGYTALWLRAGEIRTQEDAVKFLKLYRTEHGRKKLRDLQAFLFKERTRVEEKKLQRLLRDAGLRLRPPLDKRTDSMLTMDLRRQIRGSVPGKG